MAPGDFADILRRAKSGDEAAWAELYGLLAPRVLGYLRSNRAPDPEDVCGETMLQLARDVGKFEGDERGLRSWALTIAHHRLLDARRSRSRRPVDPVAEVPEAETGPGDDAETLALDRVTAQEVRRLLATLSDNQRAVLTLRLIGDLKIDEVAKVLGKRPGAIKQLQRRGLSALEKKVKDAERGGT